MLILLQVTESIVETARRLYHFELEERQYLDSLCSKVQKSVDLSSLTKDWSLLKFTTALKFLCYPRQLYEVWKPREVIVVCSYMHFKYPNKYVGSCHLNTELNCVSFRSCQLLSM